jgi:hypothetical protein
MANSVYPQANTNIRPKLVELINGMTDDQCQKLFQKMQAMVSKDKGEHPRTAYATKKAKERRSVRRVDVQCPAFVEGIPGQKTMTDVSIEGAFVECDSACKSRFSCGELIKLTIQPEPKKEAIQVQAQIVSFSDWGMHCKFAHLDRKTAVALRHWLTVT